jgi:hypothetical protein
MEPRRKASGADHAGHGRPHRRRRLATLCAAAGVGLVALLAAAPAEAAITGVGLVLSDNQESASPVTYTLTFEVGVAAASFVVALPSDVTGLSTSNVVVETSTNGSTFSLVSLSSGSVLAYADSAQNLNLLGVNLPSPLVAGDWIEVSLSSLTNPSKAETETIYLADELTPLTSTTLSSITLGSGGTLVSSVTNLIAETASVAMTIVAQATNGVSTDLSVAPVLDVSLGSATHVLDLTPSPQGATAPAASDTITVATNANSYAIEAEISGSSSALTLEGGTTTIPLEWEVNGGAPTPFSPASSGYGTIAAGLAGLTNGTTTTVTYVVPSVDLTKPAGTYQATITYLVVPQF